MNSEETKDELLLAGKEEEQPLYEEQLDEEQLYEEQQYIEVLEKRGKRKFLNGFVTGILLCLFGMNLVIFTPKALRKVLGSTNPGAEVLTESSTTKKLAEIQELLEEHFLYEVDGELLLTYLYKGLAVGLDDAYAYYYTADELSSMLDSTSGEYYGIGASIGLDAETGEFYVALVYEGCPAEAGGLLAEDLIEALDGESVDGMDLSPLVSTIKSKDTFIMTIYRPETGETLDLTITCGEVVPTYVTCELLEDGIGYIRLTEFTTSAVEQFAEAIEELNRQGMQQLIVDLRDNPGGLLSAVCDMLDELISDDLIVYTEDKDGNRTEYFAEEGVSFSGAVAVLVNGESASASEIFAGAIQDYGLGPVVGTQSYGKGVVQTTYFLSDGTALKMTVETYYTPEGQEIHGHGITPDVVAELDETTDEDEQLAAAIAALKED